jgi:hypothetical protein
MPDNFTPYQPSYPSMNPTASQFNFQPPTQNLQQILGGLQGTGSTFGMPWQAGYTAQPGMAAHPVPARPAAPAAGGFAAPGQAPPPGLAWHNQVLAKLGLPPIQPGTPQYQQWMMNQQRQGQNPWDPAGRAGSGIGGGMGGFGGGGGGGAFAGGGGAGDPGAGSHGGQPTM